MAKLKLGETVWGINTITHEGLKFYNLYTGDIVSITDSEVTINLTNRDQRPAGVDCPERVVCHTEHVYRAKDEAMLKLRDLQIWEHDTILEFFLEMCPHDACEVIIECARAQYPGDYLMGDFDTSNLVWLRDHMMNVVGHTHDKALRRIMHEYASIYNLELCMFFPLQDVMNVLVNDEFITKKVACCLLNTNADDEILLELKDGEAQMTLLFENLLQEAGYVAECVTFCKGPRFILRSVNGGHRVISNTDILRVVGYDY